jgi:hypothetical protein
MYMQAGGTILFTSTYKKSLHDSSYGRFRGNTKKLHSLDTTTRRRQCAENDPNNIRISNTRRRPWHRHIHLRSCYCCFLRLLLPLLWRNFWLLPICWHHMLTIKIPILAWRLKTLRLHCGEYGHSRKENPYRASAWALCIEDSCRL